VLGEPFSKETTADGEYVGDPPMPVGCTMTFVAVMVVPVVVPSTTADSPFVTEFEGAELVPFRYVVEDASLTVTC
jgi:hypothetical protein